MTDLGLMGILAVVEGVCDTPLRFLADKEKGV